MKIAVRLGYKQAQDVLTKQVSKQPEIISEQLKNIVSIESGKLVEHKQSSTLVGVTSSWLPKSDEDLQKVKKIVTRNITALAKKDNYFDLSFVNTYTEGLMNSINHNNGQGAIIAHDAKRWCKFIFTLANNEYISKVVVTHYQNDFGEIFRNNNIDQNEWLNLIRQFNTLGYTVTTTAGESFKYNYDFGKGSFLITRSHVATTNYRNEANYNKEVANSIQMGNDNKNASNNLKPVLSDEFHDLLVKPGDTIEQVRIAYHTSAEPEPVTSNTPGSKALRLQREGVWFFFDQTGKIYTVRLDEPFHGSVKGIKIGDSSEMVRKSLGEPTQGIPMPKSYPNSIFFYTHDGLQLRFNDADLVETIFLTK